MINGQGLTRTGRTLTPIAPTTLRFIQQTILLSSDPVGAPGMGLVCLPLPGALRLTVVGSAPWSGERCRTVGRYPFRPAILTLPAGGTRLLSVHPSVYFPHRETPSLSRSTLAEAEIGTPMKSKVMHSSTSPTT